MFFYLIHNLPWGQDLQQGKRNVRTLIIGSVCYILFHALLYADRINFPPMFSTMVFIVRRYFWFIFAADLIAMSVLYKIAYGRTIFSEIPLPQMIGDLVGRGEVPLELDVPDPEPEPMIQNEPKVNDPLTLNKDTEPVNKASDIKNTINVNDVRPLRVIDPQNMIDELQIDLLTENEGSEPDPMTVSELDGHPTQSEGESQLGDTDMEMVETEDEDETSQNQQHESEPEHEQNVESDPESDSPKLTSENINRYVKTKPKRTASPPKQPEIELQSADLNLN
jgi:hypothetical protein